MRVKELENPEQLLNISDDETYIWRLDYEITEYYKRVIDSEGYFSHIEYPYSTVKIFSQKLLDDINTNLDLKYILKEEIKVTRDIAQNILNYIRDKEGYSGGIGSKSVDTD